MNNDNNQIEPHSTPEKSYSDDKEVLVEITGLKKYFPINSKGLFKKKIGDVKAVDDFDLTIYKGEIVGLIGESGCGKTTVGRSILRAIEPTEGEIKYHFDKEYDFMHMNKEDVRVFRPKIQMIFQDPYSSLDPRMTVFDLISEPLRYHSNLSSQEIRTKVLEIAEEIGLNIQHLKRYPHAFSGGQRQRISIARALITTPEFMVADEPVSALDVSIQAQILNLLSDLQKRKGLTYLFVTHNMSVVEHLCQRIVIMYLGRIMEIATKEELFSRPMHPYTEALLSSVPVPDVNNKIKRIILEGEVPNPANPPSGCYFHPRCKYASDICKEKAPDRVEVRKDHIVACHRVEQLKLKGIL